MTGTAFVDTNVLVYRLDRSEPEKGKLAHEWMTYLWEARSGRISFQVLDEFYVTVTRKLRPGLDIASARDEVRSLCAWRPIATDRSVLEGAWRVQDRYGIAFWDGLIVSASLISGCRYLLSEDFQAGQMLDGLQVVNPFTCSPFDLD